MTPDKAASPVLRVISAHGQPPPTTRIERCCSRCGASFLGLAPGKTGKRGIWSDDSRWWCSIECAPDKALGITSTPDNTERLRALFGRHFYCARNHPHATPLARQACDALSGSRQHFPSTIRRATDAICSTCCGDRYIGYGPWFLRQSCPDCSGRDITDCPVPP